MDINAKYYIVFLMMALGACTRVNLIEGFNEPPVIIFNEMEGALFFSDSIKLSLKHSQKVYEIILQVVDPNENIASVIYELNNGEGSLFQNGIAVEAEGNFLHLLLENNTIVLGYEPSELGLHTMKFSVKDDFGKTAEFTFELVAFNNLKPVAKFEIVKPETPVVPMDPLEWIVDASESFDLDEKFGGEVFAFEYSVLGKTLFLQESVIPIIFPISGKFYDIGVRVMDNDGEWSEVVVKTVFVE